MGDSGGAESSIREWETLVGLNNVLGNGGSGGTGYGILEWGHWWD